MDKGFTLIELLVVVMIVGVLAGIAIPNLTGDARSNFMADCEDAGWTEGQCNFMYRHPNFRQCH